ncbi:MAG TPA: endonuclease domain-containing protein [Urbifossiella sp.]|nr:endonuclease domain-containing protein [Urbifossiella sp.]
MNPDPKRRASPRLARALRRTLTPAEAILWRELRDRQLGGYKFRRQQPVGPFVADFCCQAARLVVELDGDSHVGREGADAARTAFLESAGYLVVRFWNVELIDDLDGVLEAILSTCTTRVSADTNLKLDPTLPAPGRPTAPTLSPPGERVGPKGRGEGEA